MRQELFSNGLRKPAEYELSPEVKIAQRIVSKYNLKPPVTIEAVIKDYADIEIDKLPVDADAITLNLKDKRAKIILNSLQSPIRQRFTLAHEFGHIRLPWHVGTMAISHIWGFGRFKDHIYRSMEAEANRFAAELLIPSAWLDKWLDTSCAIDDLNISLARICNVSNTVAALVLINKLPSGYLFTEINNEGKVIYTARSPKSIVLSYDKGDIINSLDAYPGASAKYIVPSVSTNIIWAFYESTVKIPKVSDPNAWRSTLDSILDDLNIAGENARKIKMSISGIVGSANSQFMKSRNASELYNILRHRFSARADLNDIVSHKNFNKFLAQRARAIKNR